MAGTNMKVFMFTFCCWIGVNASTTFFNSTDSTIAALTSKPLSMTCGLKASHRDDTSIRETIKHLVSITIKHRRKAIATINNFMPGKAMGDLDLHVEGDVTGTSGRNAYMSVTWPHPSHSQVGDYQCEMTAFTASGNSVVLKTSLKIRESSEQQFKTDVSGRSNDADEILMKIDELSRKLVMQEDNIDKLNQAKKALEAKMDQINQAKNSKIQALEAKIDQINQAKISKIQALEVKIQVLETQMDKTNQAMNSQRLAVEKQNKPVNTPVFFSAGVGSDVTLSHEQTLVFNKVIDSVGGGYNSGSGEFRCPVAGHYMFTVHVMNLTDKPVGLIIKHNGASLVHMYADDNMDFNTVSNSVVVELQLGDVVKVTSRRDSYVFGNIYPETTFTGLLLSPI